MLDELIKHLPAPEDVIKETDEIKVAIIGRPNVGKSSLLNAFIGENRSIVSPISGTTRDAIDMSVERNGRKYRLIDTAGVRRKKNIDYGDAFAKYGVIGVLMRIEDKIQRSLSITKNGVNLVQDEGIKDTLLDLHNYAAMALMLLDE